MAQTTVSGVLFENDLRKMIATLVWHNKYLGDKYDKESKYVDAVEVDTYLTGARHLLMTNTKYTLENVESMNETDYLNKMRSQLYHSDSPSDLRELKFWDMFYYGKKYEDERGNPLPNELLTGARKYVEKNTYYRELYGLPMYAGTICHCKNCEYEAYNMTVCPRCGETLNIDPFHDAPSMYSYIAQFPKYNNRPVQQNYYLYDDDGNKIINDPNSDTYNPELPDTDEKGVRLDFNPLVFIYERPKVERMYAAHTTTFVDDCIEKTKNDRNYRYLTHMTYTKIHPFEARISDRFEILYLADSEIIFLNQDFRKVYDECRLFMKYRYYTEAFRNQYREYEGFIGMAIMFMALERMQAKYLEADITRDFYDLESIEVVYNAYSVPFYNEIPITYHNKIIKSINRLLSIKGTNKCFREIFAIFGYSTLNMYQYYILKTQKRDGDGRPLFAFDENGNEIPESMYDVQIVKADIGENPYTYILDSLNYLNYYGVTEPDTYWLNDEDLLYKLYHSDYNFIETKYIGIQMAFSLTRLTIETEYLMRMLLDNRYSGTDNLTIYHGRIGRDISVYDLVIYIMYTVGMELNLENGGSLDILQDPAKLSAIYGFNFLEDFTEVYGYLSRKFIYNYKSGYITEKSGTMEVTENGRTVTKDVVSKYFHPTDYSDIDIMQMITDETILDHMYNESNLNDIKHTDIPSFFNMLKTFINTSTESVTISPNGLELHLVYAFNTIRKILASYTSEEIQMKDILSEKFTTTYWSPEVCAYCGMTKEDIGNQYAYCTNINCVSNHDYGSVYNHDYGPKLIDADGNIPTDRYDTSKDTLNHLIRNNVYADFIHKFSNINPLVHNMLDTFDPFTDLEISDMSINGLTFDLEDTLTKQIIYFVSNDRNIYIDEDSAYDLYKVNPGNEITVRYTRDSQAYNIKAYVLYIDPTIVTIPIEEEDVNFVRIVLDRVIDIPEDATNIYVDIKYRTIEISFDEWHEMMMSGVTALRYTNMAYDEYIRIMTERETDPESHTEYEVFEAYNVFVNNEYVYQNTLYYLLNVLSSFIDSADDIDLSNINWKYRYWDDLPTSDESIFDEMRLRMMPEASEIYYDGGYNIIYVGETLLDETVELFIKNHIYVCDAEIVDDEPVYYWKDVGIYTPQAPNNVKSILESLNMYMALVGLRSKHEFTLYISNQISELTPIVSEPHNDGDTIPVDPNDYDYIPPYYDKINDVHLLHLYLQFYFIDNRYMIDKKDRKSQLATVVDRYYLDDYLHFVSDYKYGAIDSISADTSYSYMNEQMRSVRDGRYGIKIFDYIKTNIRDILDQDDSIQNTHEITIGVGKTASDFNDLKDSYASITDLYKAFIELTWNAKDPKTFYAIRRLQKMLMTTRYAKEIYALKGTENDANPKIAESYKELLDSIDPILSSRIENMTQTQRIDELEYSLDCLSKCADDLIYIHAYGGFNMKKIISYIFQLLLFFKSAKADLLDYALEFHIDDKTDNMIKYMTELVKLSTNTIMSPDKWRFTDYVAEHESLIRLNFDKSIKINFMDHDTILLLESYVHPWSNLNLMDQIRHHDRSTVISADLNYNLSDRVKHLYDNIIIDTRYNVERVFKAYKYIVNVRRYAMEHEEASPYTQYDEDLAYNAYRDALNTFENGTINDRNMTFDDTLALKKRVVYKLDYEATPVVDEYGNLIYPKQLDERGLPVITVTTDFVDPTNESEE
jgi:hypothetical protein